MNKKSILVVLTLLCCINIIQCEYTGMFPQFYRKSDCMHDYDSPYCQAAPITDCRREYIQPDGPSAGRWGNFWTFYRFSINANNPNAVDFNFYEDSECTIPLIITSQYENITNIPFNTCVKLPRMGGGMINYFNVQNCTYIKPTPSIPSADSVYFVSIGYNGGNCSAGLRYVDVERTGECHVSGYGSSSKSYSYPTDVPNEAKLYTWFNRLCSGTPNVTNTYQTSFTCPDTGATKTLIGLYNIPGDATSGVAVGVCPFQNCTYNVNKRNNAFKAIGQSQFVVVVISFVFLFSMLILFF